MHDMDYRLTTGKSGYSEKLSQRFSRAGISPTAIQTEVAGIVERV